RTACADRQRARACGRAETAQVDLRSTADAAQRAVVALRADHLRHAIQHVFDAKRAALLELRRIDLRDRTDADQVRLLDARASHRHYFNRLGLLNAVRGRHFLPVRDCDGTTSQ